LPSACRRCPTHGAPSSSRSPSGSGSPSDCWRGKLSSIGDPGQPAMALHHVPGMGASVVRPITTSSAPSPSISPRAGEL
jgi:hypothetical protein